MMTERMPRAVRRSPIRLAAAPAQTESREGWEVVLGYEEEGEGPWLVDLSHRRRWDLQDRDVAARRPFGRTVPAAPGEVRIERGLMLSRMNRTQVTIAHVGPDATPAEDAVHGDIGPGCTETTDAHAWLAVIGPRVAEVLEHACPLDLFPAGRQPPLLTQGPVLHVPCQIVTCGRDRVLLTLARGYAQTFAESMLHSGRRLGLAPGGERRFTG